MDSTDQDAIAEPAATAKKKKKKREPRRWFSGKVITVIFVCGVLGLVLGYFASLTQPYIWKVEATLLAHVGRESGSARSEIVAAGGSSHVMSTPSAESLNTEINLLKSPALLRATWDSVKAELQAILDEQRAEAERAGRTGGGGGGPSGGFSLMGMLNEGVTSLYRALDLAYEVDPDELQFVGWSATLNVAQLPRSNMLMVTTVSPSPKLAKLSLERWLTLYKETHIEAFSQKETEPLFKDETKRLSGEVRRIEGLLTDFRLENNIFDIDTAKKTLLNQKLGLEDQLRGLATEMATATTRMAELEDRLQDLPDQSLQSSSSTTSPTWDYLDRQLVEAEQRLANAELEYPEGTVFRRIATEKRDIIKEMMLDQPVVRQANKIVSRDPIHSDLLRDWYQVQIGIKSDEARKVAIEANRTAVTEELTKLEDLRAEHNTLLDELAETRKDLAKFKEGARIARMNNTLDEARVTNVRIVSPPSIPSEPVELLGLPHRVAITGIGGAVGIFLALGIYLVLMSLREAGILKRAITAAAAQTDVDPLMPDHRELGVWAITDDDDLTGGSSDRSDAS